MSYKEAFPVPHPNVGLGMSLRDYFAAKAMQAVITMDEDIDYDYISAVAYEMADAMMEARED